MLVPLDRFYPTVFRAQSQRRLEHDCQIRLPRIMSLNANRRATWIGGGLGGGPWHFSKVYIYWVNSTQWLKSTYLDIWCLGHFQSLA